LEGGEAFLPIKGKKKSILILENGGGGAKGARRQFGVRRCVRKNKEGTREREGGRRKCPPKGTQIKNTLDIGEASIPRA